MIRRLETPGTVGAGGGRLAVVVTILVSERLSRRHVPMATAAEWIADATRIRAVLDCKP